MLSASKNKISFLLCDNAFIRTLNRRYLGENSSTDVLAFSLSDSQDPAYLGDVVVSVEKALKVAGHYGNNWEEETTLYCIHGVLHLVGYDDVTRHKRLFMEKKQEEIMKKLKFRSGKPRLPAGKAGNFRQRRIRPHIIRYRWRKTRIDAETSA
jgi:probable rRNA maturation factor